MVNLFLFLSIIFLVTFVIGKLLEKIRIPWIFAALLFGIILSIFNPFSLITSSPTFEFLGNLGMYFLLFLIGFEINLKEVIKKNRWIIKSTLLIILFETLVGTILIYFIFPLFVPLDQLLLSTSLHPLFLSMIIALSFATVGEAFLFPILDEFNLFRKKLGQAIVGIGVLDNIIELLVIIIVVLFLGITAGTQPINIWIAFLSLTMMFLLTYGLRTIEKRDKIKFPEVELLFLFAIFIFFLFVGIGKLTEAAALGAILAGIAIKNFIPPQRLKLMESELKSVGYGIFGPIFFVWVGVATQPEQFNLWLVILLVLFANSAKIFASYLTGRKILGTKESICLGIGLSIRFSTSIVIVTILFKSAIISGLLFSTIIWSSIIFKFIIPFLLSHLLVRWKIANKSKRSSFSSQEENIL